MARQLEGLKPERVFYYFEEISKIPRGSGNTKAISDYLVGYAKDHGLSYRQDEWNNVVIRKKATPGYETHPVVMLQGHMDMVCEKTAESTHDFLKDPLDLYVEDGFVKARGTTLGADDGIAVAYILSILEDDTIPSPELEAVITVDEEIGMLGAAAMDMSDLKAHYVINIDSEDEGIFLSGCAGGLTAHLHLPYTYVEAPEDAISYELTIGGLTGGHSGQEIHKGRASAHVLLGRVLACFDDHSLNYGIAGFQAGTKDNVIPNGVTLELFLEPEELGEFQKLVDALQEVFLQEFKTTDPNLFLSFKEKSIPSRKIIDFEAMAKLTYILTVSPAGVARMSPDIEGLVETSLNMGILHLGDEEIEISYLIRSSIESAKYALYDKIRYIGALLGCEVDYTGAYPGWQYRKDSLLQKAIKDLYEEQTGKKGVIEAIHAGVECGMFDAGLKDADIVSFGPNLYDIHTFHERMDIASAERTYDLLVSLLERL
ncbi:MAG: aminoacyl-histidine dipeptidase [Lachnospiraceae bacterium]|nr:aminoacyl-histidine dipeptidase [Lachnospiraceae bacterium]